METINLDGALKTLKMLLGIKDNDSDELLSFLIEDAVNMILGYCHIDILPKQLESFVPMIAADVYRAKGYGKAAAPQIVATVTEDKRSFSLRDTNINATDILANYESRLKPFRNRRGKVPSDVG